MPYPNEHAARLIDPDKFDADSFRRENDKFGDGIHAVFGKLKGEDSMTLQAIRFDADRFSPDEARKWLEEHGYHPIVFEEAAAEKSFSYFLPLQKVDEVRREVWGVAAVEQPDQSGEIMDYEKSKPHFWAWSKRVQKASQGKSLGNVRDSHTSKAVGKVIKLLFDDKAKAIRVGTKIVDSEAWQKVVEGVFTGFSVGGVYGKRWPDPMNKGFIRYEAIPSEISLVDLPCIPGAVIEMVKADGSQVILSTKGVAMKNKIRSVLKKQLEDLTDEELANLVEELAAVLEESDEANDESASEEEQSTESGSEESEEKAAEEQPKGLTADDVREIVLALLRELGLIEQVGGEMTLSAKIKGLAKAETADLRKSLEKIIKDIAQLAVAVETLEKRGGSGPVLREIGALSPQAGATLQKIEQLRSALETVTDPLTRQSLQNEIARLEIQAIQKSK
jgi:hypothetical protein